MAGEDGLEVRRYTADDRPLWDDFVRRARAPHFMFERGYMDYHADRFEDHSLLLLDAGSLAAVLPANRDGGRLVSHGGLTFGGLVTDRRGSANRVLGCFEAVLGHLREAGLDTWIYKPVPHIYHAVPAEEDLYALYRCGARLVRRDLSATVVLADRLAYSKGRLSSVKKGRRLAVARDDDWAGYWALEEEALARRHGVAPVHSAEEIAMLAGRFPENIALFTARDDGVLLGGVVIFETPTLAHAQYIASSVEGRDASAVDAVIDHLLTDVYAGKRFFDLGISTEEAGRVLNVGLARNKESYGARGVVYDWYELTP